MARPDASDFTDRLYDRLPELYKAADEADGDYPLLRYLSLLGDQAGEVETLLDRVDPDVAGVSELLDADLADAAWLDWLAQVVGVPSGDYTIAELRAAISGADALRQRGSSATMADAVRPLLTGAQYVYIASHYGDVWTVAILTVGIETPTTSDELLAAAALNKPAGVTLVHLVGLTWDDIEAYPTWDDIELAGSWDALTII
jgi:hypothetical protein